MKLFAFVAQSLLWLVIAASPTLVGLIAGFILSSQAGDLYNFAVPICGIIGFIFGGMWAEHIRKTIGLSAFLGRISGIPELNNKDKKH